MREKSVKTLELAERIKVEDYSTENTLGITYTAHTSHGDYENCAKKTLSIEDFLGVTAPENGGTLSNIPKEFTDFSNQYVTMYENMKADLVDEDGNQITLEEYLNQLVSMGEFSHTNDQPFRQFLSAVLVITIILPLIEACTGTDYITDEDLSDFERGMKGAVMGTSQNKGDNMIKDFIKEKDIKGGVIAKYQGIVGEDVVKMWKEYGEGSFLNGYLRIINPDDYAELVRTSYFKGDSVVPLFVSAFGDVIVFDGEFLTSIYYKEHDFKVMNKGLALFFRYLEVDGYKKDYFDLDLFEEAKKFVGILKNDECYCFVPVLPLGGKKSVKTLEIGKTREHIEVITQLVGGVGMV